MPKVKRKATRGKGRRAAGPPVSELANSGSPGNEAAGGSADVSVASLSLQQLLDAVGERVRQESLNSMSRAGTAGGASSVSGGQADFQRPSSEVMLAVLVE